MLRTISPRTKRTAKPVARHVATVDRRRARLIRIESSDLGGEHAEEIDAFAEKWIEKEHGRPMMLSPNGGRLSPGRDEERERTARFARDVAAWLERDVVPRVKGGVALYCAPSLFGTLRGILPDRLHGRVDVRRRNLANLTPAGIAKATRDGAKKA